MRESIEIHPCLVEQSVWEALRGSAEAGLYHRQRERLYRPEDLEERDSAFADLHASWFRRLELGAPIRQAVAEQHEMLASVDRIVVGPAVGPGKPCAELYVNAADTRSVVVGIDPRVLIDRDQALSYLRREFMHIADMLDPAFEYEPRLPPQPAGPTHDQLLLDRYRTVWECSIDGRLLRLGRVPATVRERQRQSFMRAFPGLGSVAEESFARIFDDPRPSHRSIVAMASDPEAYFGGVIGSSPRNGRCPLCAFPTFEFEPAPETLSRAVLTTVRSEFPEWQADKGLCRQCADLYRARCSSDGAVDQFTQGIRKTC